ncbi:MAG: nickel pincer cofactor biosynthesis protein LarC [Candidatus Edwardsbacteria bacterium]|nr:nickel pincer cofactor biosynthesis protein LarC [Candidatus Edwardsbacteria bacterium]
MKTIFFDCPTGVSGNMILAALIDAGAGRNKILRELKKIPVSGWDIRLKQVAKQGVGGLHLEVRYREQPERNLSQITALIKKAKFKPTVEKRIIEAFTTLARAEAGVHRTAVDKIHFHEVGAIDSIIDIAGTMLALDDLDIEKIYCSPLNIGKGTVKCRHGLLPVPAPATALLLKKAKIYQNELSGELTTPTGALLMTYLADSFGPMPPMSLTAVGQGAGTMDLPVPNILRAMVGESYAEGKDLEQMVLLETNIDDMNPQICGYVMDLLFRAGAADVYFTPIQMKKNRPAVMLSALVDPSQEKKAVDIIMRETTTLGLRRMPLDRYVISRKAVKVRTEYGIIEGKVAELPGGEKKFQPEYDSCLSAAHKFKAPLRKIFSAAMAAYRKSEK